MLNEQLQLANPIPLSSSRPLRHALWAMALLSLAILGGCGTSLNPAPVVDLSSGVPVNDTALAAGGSYVVKPGDTLYKIARSANVDIESLKRLNNLSDPNQISVGQTLRLSAGSNALAPSAAQPAPVAVVKPPASSEPRPLDAPDPGAQPTPTPTPTPEPAAQATPAPAADASRVKWAWPVNGSIIQTFTSTTKGIDIAGKEGDPVTAAADGKVMYGGNGVRGLGNLIIIDHGNGFISAYGHNRSLLVKTGAQVKRGAKIAEMGQTDTSSPRLHFEIRRQGTAVDPQQYLPAR